MLYVRDRTFAASGTKSMSVGSRKDNEAVECLLATILNIADVNVGDDREGVFQL